MDEEGRQEALVKELVEVTRCSRCPTILTLA